MTTLRQAAQWALQYLESNADADSDWEIITALRAALEQPEKEPVAWTEYDLDEMVEAFSRVIEAHHYSKHPFHNPIDMDARMALRILRGFIPAIKAFAAPPQRPAEPVQEPVAWISALLGHVTTQDMSHTVSWAPLYTAPPQRKPLTEEKIKDCLDAADQMYCERDGDKEVFKARAIEAAHNIKE